MDAEIGLANIDDSIADADGNIRQLGYLVAEMARNGHPTAEIERDLVVLTKALHGVRACRRTIVTNLDGVQPLPRIAHQRKRTQRNASKPRVAHKRWHLARYLKAVLPGRRPEGER
jgi:hypothetical protein